MSGRRKGPSVLSPEDRRLWEQVSGKIKPLTGRDRLHSRAAELLPQAASVPTPASPKRRPSAMAGQVPAMPPAARPKPPAPLSHGSREGLDRRKAERLSRGKLPIEATLDLHGLRQAEAHRRLEAFLTDSQAAGKRCILIVTGKGQHKEEAGVLRSAVPRWLNEAPNRARVISFDYAQPRHGGSGALYVLLRRRR